MPVYLNRCKDCEHEWEQYQAITEAAITECPLCNGQVGRVPQAVGIAFVGSGFYVNDK